MNRDQKAAVVDRIASAIEQSDAIFALDYRGISVKQAADLRAALIDADASFRIVKNTLTERAADRARAESLKELLDGPTALTFISGDVAVAAKALATFRRREGILEIKGGRMNGEPLSIEQIEEIGRLPARDVLSSQFVGVLASPLTGLVRGLGSLVSGLAVALRQVEEQGLVGGAEDAAAPEPASAEQPAEAPAGEAAGQGETPAEGEAPEATPAAGEAAPADADAETAAGQPPETVPAEAPGDPVAEAEAAEKQDADAPGEAQSEEG